MTTPIDYNSLINIRDFKVELFPLHSPLLRESWLVSFPPLSNMLKSSGSSYLIGGPKGIGVLFDAIQTVNTLHRDCLRVIEAPTQSSDLHRRLFTSGGLPARGSKAAHSPQLLTRRPGLSGGPAHEEASGVNRHSNKHAPRHIPEAQCAFKILMIH